MHELNSNGENRWIEVLAKATAMLALQGAEIDNRLEQAEFLMGFGFTRPEAARMLGIEAHSLRSLAHQAKGRGNKKGGRNGKAKGKR